MTPRDAERMLLEPPALRFACDPFANRQFLKADGRTRDFRGLRLVDYLSTPDAVERATTALKETVEALLEGRRVDLDPLRCVELPRPGQSPRIVYIPTYQRRCLSNLLSRVLSEATKALLPSNVRAYIPDLFEAVPEAILDLAEAAKAGHLSWWWKVDFRSFFSSVPHPLVEDSLRHYGFSGRMVRLVLACVRTPHHRRGPGGAWRMTPNQMGVPMGLAESSVLANLACFSFDEHFDNVRRRITQVRYSDDVLGGTHLYQEAVGAVRHLRKWTSAHGLKIKGMSPDTQTTSLVHDLRHERMPALGAEIDHEGAVHIPRTTRESKLQEIDLDMDTIERTSGRPIEEESVYCRGRGTNFRDLDDVRERVNAFISYWTRLNLDEADEFRAEVERRHPDILSPRRSEAVWIASLGSPGGAGGGGHGPPAPSPEASSPRQGSPLTRCPGQGEDSIFTNSGSGAGNTRPEGIVGFEDAHGTNDRHVSLDEDPVLGFESVDGVEADRIIDTLLGGEVGDTGVEGEDDIESSINTDEARDEGPEPSTDGEVSSSQVADTVPSPDQSTRSGTGPTYEPSSPEPPRYSALDNQVWIVVRAVPFRKGGPGVVVGMLRGDPDAFGERPVEVALVPNVRPGVALLAAIEKVVAASLRRGERQLDVHVESASLPKHLVVRSRRFHSPLHFGRVLRLHAMVGGGALRLRILGGQDLPSGLRGLMERWRGQSTSR